MNVDTSNMNPAQKAWVTRKRKAAAKKAVQTHKRRAAANKAWVTRRKNEK